MRARTALARAPDRRDVAGGAPSRRALLGAIIGALAFAAVTLTSAGHTRAADLQPLEIATKNGVQVFSVELVATDEERARGLMFRREVPDGYGMLFDFKKDGEITMWMENTYVPLDMLFIRSDGRIARIAENTEPLSRRMIPSGGPVRAVLEVVGGTARKLGIAVGDRVGHPMFKPR